MTNLMPVLRALIESSPDHLWPWLWRDNEGQTEPRRGAWSTGSPSNYNSTGSPIPAISCKCSIFTQRDSHFCLAGAHCVVQDEARTQEDWQPGTYGNQGSVHAWNQCEVRREMTRQSVCTMLRLTTVLWENARFTGNRLHQLIMN